MPRNRFMQWLGRMLLRAGGWRMQGAFPDIPKAVVIAAPHSSNWDGIWGFAAKLALGVKLSILGKHSLFHIPLVGAFLRWQGVIPVDRSAAHGIVGQAVDALRGADCMWYAIAPEGTRKRVARWKPGFWHIAHGAGVPVIPAYFDYANKVIGIGPPFVLGDDMQADIARIQRWYAPFKGRNHDVTQPQD
ncbi:MAG: lysophospholipid acyltransferase family protein [Thermomonas sp.]|uniref:lysophospholipid acyltransferase family protein n=1 Tax=Thermomonas sp. TaxID=1971895 RepID=UPI0039E55E8B